MRDNSKVSFKIKEKPRKRLIEPLNRSCVNETGGVFGLMAREPYTHYALYSSVLRKESPFAMFEIEPKLTGPAEALVKAFQHLGENRVELHVTDVWNIFDLYPVGRVPLFRVAHLDFCVTAKTLMRDYELIKNLKKLAQWGNLKSPFYLEITFCRHGGLGGNSLGKEAVDHIIPKIFKDYGWRVKHPRQMDGYNLITDYKYGVGYRDGAPMINGFYKMTRR